MQPRSIRFCLVACSIVSSLTSASAATLRDTAAQTAQPAAAPDENATIPAIWTRMSPAARLMAQRAARVDARLHLIERIKGLYVAPTVQVRDFAAETDLLGTALRHVVRGAVEVASQLCADQPIAEATLRLPGEQVARAVRMLHQQYYKGTEIRPDAIDKCVAEIGHTDLEATGIGMPPRVYLDEIAATTGQSIPTWASGSIEADAASAESSGGAIDPFQAARAAETAARRALAQKIAQLPGPNNQPIESLIAASEDVRSAVDSLVAEASVSHTRLDRTSAEVTLRIPGVRIWDAVRRRKP